MMHMTSEHVTSPARADDAPDIFTASASGDIAAVVHILLADEHQIAACDAEGWTPLHLAIREGHYDVARALVMNGAPVNVTDTYKKSSPLHLAVCTPSLVELLIQYGADVMARDANGSTPLHKAAYDGHLATAELLLANGANPDAEDHSGYTPLHAAAFDGHTAVVHLLLQQQATVDSADHSGCTPLHAAAFDGHAEVVELLVAYGAALNPQDNLGWTPLHVAAFDGHAEVVAFLVNRGADMRACDRCGQTPMTLALAHDHSEVVELLHRDTE